MLRHGLRHIFLEDTHHDSWTKVHKKRKPCKNILNFFIILTHGC